MMTNNILRYPMPVFNENSPVNCKPMAIDNPYAVAARSMPSDVDAVHSLRCAKPQPNDDLYAYAPAQVCSSTAHFFDIVSDSDVDFFSDDASEETRVCIRPKLRLSDIATISYASSIQSCCTSVSVSCCSSSVSEPAATSNKALLYDNLRKYDAYEAASHSLIGSSDECFLLLEQEEEEGALVDVSSYECEEDTPDMAHTTLESMVTAPMIDIAASGVITDQDEMDEWNVYDDSTGHCLAIPEVFRHLSLSAAASPHSDDVACSMDCSIPKQSKQSKLRVDWLSGLDSLDTCLDASTRNILDFGVESPVEYEADTIRCFAPQLAAMMAESEASSKEEDEQDWQQDESSCESKVQHKRFTFSVHPSEISLSDDACQHLLNLIECETDDERI